MAFSFNKKSKDPISEINVTPFVDVMLVLLIVFMVFKNEHRAKTRHPFVQAYGLKFTHQPRPKGIQPAKM